MSLMIPVFSSAAMVVLLYLAEKHTQVQKLPYTAKQLIIGILFGGLAIFSGLHGIELEDMIINVSDAAPLCAGLVFGAPAGIISGVIGGLFRFFWGIGDYTRLAGSVSIVLIGFIAALMRNLMFDDKKPTWVYGVGIACVCEDIHMLLIFLFNLDDAATAFSFVNRCTVPMVIGNAAAIGLALIVVAFLSREKTGKKKKTENIAQTFQRWLLVCIVSAYVLTSVFTYRLQSNMTETQIMGVINQTLADVSQDIKDTSGEHLLEATRLVEGEYLASSDWDSESLLELAESCGVAGINVFGSDGIITNSSFPDVIGFDMNSGSQSEEFMCLFNGKTEYVQEYQPLAYDSSMTRKYAGILLPDGTALQAGYSYEQYKKEIDNAVFNATKNRHIGTNGFILICDENWLVVADGYDHDGMRLSELGIQIDKDTMLENTQYKAYINEEEYLYSFLFTEGYCIIGAVPEAEAHYMRNVSIYVSVLAEVIIFATLFVLVYFLLKKVIINNLREINNSLAQITNGNLNVTVNVRTNAEFSSLSDDINSTVSTLKAYIAETAARIDQELEYAKEIQCSALPSVFPPYPNQDQFDIYARMFTAKEVGGDFYDFYMPDDYTIAFLIADVSGKGIPAALFMMTAKTTIKDLAERGLPVNEILSEANEKLCKGNEAGMFVTACMGILDLRNGKLSLANAGHNPPLMMHKGGMFEYLRMKPGFVLAGMEGVRYRLNEYTLHPGDRIFFYTDGVTEATDEEKQLYGENRLRAFVNSHAGLAASELLNGLKADIDLFVGDAPQFDDITMLMFDYLGGAAMKEERTFPADVSVLPEVQGFFEGLLEQLVCPLKTQLAVSVVIEEVFVNIAHYAYPEGSGTATVGFAFDPESRTATFVFRDRGIPFDPLKQEVPDITLSVEERGIGGLGILITRKTMDSVTYRYENGENILTMQKTI